MVICGVRVLYIATDDKLSQAAVNQSTRKYFVANLRGTIYDCNGSPITELNTKPVTVIFPTEKGSITLSNMLDGEELLSAEKLLSQGSPVTINGACPDGSGGAVTLDVPIRYSGSLSHILGYIDSTGHGVTGIEKSLDNILYNSTPLSVSYSTDSLGHMLAGEGFSINNNQPKNSVTLTIDNNIQKIVENAMSNVTAGAAVVVEAESGKIRASVSRPDYDQNNVAAFLNSENSPLINRALYTYNIGSVFKPCLAAAAIENGEANFENECLGSISSGELTFKCHKIEGHGLLDLKGAIAESCNTYFYNLSTKLGAKKVYNAAKKLRFGEELNLGGGIISNKGNVPSLETLENSEASLINLSIGQGDLLLSPIALSCLYTAIVNKGKYLLPTLIEGISENGVYKEQSIGLPTYAMSENTANILKKYLENALINGTGHSGYSEGILAGGKTGTAQTGWKDGDRNILNGWFCGFYEGLYKTYVIVILKEDVKSGSADCAPIFKTITEQIKFIGY